MNDIVRPITEDGNVGFDEYNQLVLRWPLGKDSFEYRFIKDVRGKRCPICLQAWLPTAASMRDQVQWRLIDEWVHETCLYRHIGFVERQEFFSAIVEAELRFDGLRPIENRYWPKSYEASNKPWYETKLLDYPTILVIGHRKRVTEIELTPVKGSVLIAEWFRDAFKAEDVTKKFDAQGVRVHAWNDEKVGKYLGVIAELLRNGCVQDGK
jgi:hypothetical protein